MPSASREAECLVAVSSSRTSLSLAQGLHVDNRPMLISERESGARRRGCFPDALFSTSMGTAASWARPTLARRGCSLRRSRQVALGEKRRALPPRGRGSVCAVAAFRLSGGNTGKRVRRFGRCRSARRWVRALSPFAIPLR